MYGKNASKLLSSVSAEAGDKIKVISKKQTYEGLLMPRIDTGDTECITIKLSSGYNVGIDVKEVERIELIEKGAGQKKIAKGTPDTTKPSKDDIVILGCGGTIASKIEYRTGAVYPAMTTEELIRSFPQLKEKKIRSRMLFSLLSENMTPAHWQENAKEVAAEIKQGCKGIVLMHGTDTMHFTAAALSFMLKTPVPIVLVGSQRSSDRGSSDSMMNLLAAVMVAESDIAGVTVCMHATTNDDFCYLHSGVHVRKMHTSARNAFKSVNITPIAKISPNEKKIELIGTGMHLKRGEQKLEVDTKINPNVALIYTYPGINKEFITKVGKGSDGMVIAGTGLGHVPESIIPEIKNIIDNGVPVVIAPQTIFGRINLNVYEAGRKLNDTGVIGHLCDWTPETALVKLMFVLGHVKKIEDVRKMMLTNIAGEITERSETQPLDGEE